MRTFWLMAAILGLLLAATGVHAQPNYPNKPIRLIVPLAPGGGVDFTARLLAEKLTESFKQTVIVDNRPGGGGVIAFDTAVRASPDGYTLILVSTAYTTNAALGRLSFDPVNDVAPIALVAEVPFMVALHPSVPVKSIKELIAFDRAAPGKINYGSSGTGAMPHMATELLNYMAGTKMTHVPYKGAGPALTDLIGGRIQLLLAGIAPMIPHLKANRLRGIAITSAKRSNALPDIPTVGESVPGYEVVPWNGVWGSKALPKDIVARWNREIDRAVQLPDVKERMASDGMVPVGGPPERFREVLVRDIAKWRKVVKIADIKPES